MSQQDNNRTTGVRRRELLGLGVGATALALTPGSGQAAAGNALPETWDREVDVICVGSGAAACSAAIAAADAGASVVVLEKLPISGGTTGKSGGVTWIPNHRFLRARGIEDGREDCLRYLARYAYPGKYTPDSDTLGLSRLEFDLLAAFYDNGASTIDFLEEVGAASFREFKMWHVDKYAPDYADHLPENKVPRGRALEPAAGAGSSEGGGSLAAQLAAWLRANDVPILTGHRVSELHMRDGRVIGAAVEHAGGTLHIRARRGVVFGTGGFAHNVALSDTHQTFLYGSCAMPGSTGDFIRIGSSAGAIMGALHTAWRTQVVVEEALANRSVALGAFVLPGDSMLVVNKYGQRVTNEKRNYNDRTRSHFSYDPTREEYPNQLQFMIFDQRSLDAFAGAYPFPANVQESPALITSDSLTGLTKQIQERLARHAQQIAHVQLSDGFAGTLASSIDRFNAYAIAGVDEEHQRGQHEYDRDWHGLFSPRNPNTTYAENPYPNPTMHPLAASGPYHAFILGAGALDTNGGPLINASAQVLGADGAPIPGLYGAGNCIASPTRQAYTGAGGTIGLALTFGNIAGRHVVGKA
ncbi:MAG: FAD-dependent oxidoreductase [Chromatocurvus sp.]